MTLNEIRDKARRLAEAVLNRNPEEKSDTFCHNTQSGPEKKVFELLTDSEYFSRRSLEYISYDPELGWAGFRSRLARKKRMRINLFRYAAAVLLISALPALYFSLRIADESYSQVTEICPGSSRATLVLESGETVQLGGENANSREIFYDPDHFVLAEDGSIDYKADIPISVIQHHTIITPRGGEYRVTLSDGTTVRLNADSRLTYPNAFEDGQRVVKLTGEAYFEVARDERRPFVVETSRMNVRVLGTSFNLSSYIGETNRTTLVEGSVEVCSDGHRMRILPGEQAVLTSDGFEKRTVDVARYVGWKDNLFRYTDTPLAEVYRELERWYDVEFVPQGEHIERIKFTANLPKYENIDTVLDIINYVTGTEYGIYGRTVTVK